MDEFIEKLLADIFNSLENVSDPSKYGSLGTIPEDFIPEIYSWVVDDIAKGVVMPIGYVILGLLLVWEMYNITMRTNMSGNQHFEIPIKAMIKAVLCKIFLEKTIIILDEIYNVTNKITIGIGEKSFGSGGVENILNSLTEEIASEEFLTKVMICALVLIVWLIFKLSMGIVSVMIIGRMIEIYVMTAIAPLPMATAANQELNGIAKNFLKNYAAVCLQGTFILLVLTMYGKIIEGFVDGLATGDSLLTAMITLLGYAFFLLLTVGSASKWAKAVCNAM